ncbi:hypothetical protein [Christiangramia echinicola]|nr:hypothetical protein [Christiangramia echinicola]
MKKVLKDFKERSLKDLSKIQGGGDTIGVGGVIDRDKIKTPKPGKRD